MYPFKTHTYSLLLVFIIAISCNQNKNVSLQEETANGGLIILTDEQLKNAGIETGKPKIQPVHETVSATGVLDVPPQNLIDISAPMGGFVKETKLLQGMAVKKGDVLVELQHPDYIQLQQDYLSFKSQYELLSDPVPGADPHRPARH